jgi:hypothetical protein
MRGKDATAMADLNDVIFLKMLATGVTKVKMADLKWTSSA